MNKVILMGNLVKDPNVTYPNEKCIAKYTVAVRRTMKNKDGKYDSDFISCVAFGKSGEFAEKYFKKGTKVLVTGRIQTGSYPNKDGQTVYTTDVIVEEQEFAGSKADTESKPNVNSPKSGFEAINIPIDLDDEMPFV